jgi:hypothetical protein
MTRLGSTLDRVPETEVRAVPPYLLHLRVPVESVSIPREGLPISKNRE